MSRAGKYAGYNGEPDSVDFEAHGLQCAMRRGRSGAWCGYIGLTSDHALHGRDYSDSVVVPPSVRDREVQDGLYSPIALFINATGDSDENTLSIDCCFDVHGGITYAGDQPGGGGETKDMWWLGFDCCHSGDLSPRDEDGPEFWRDGIYRDLAYVENQCKEFARQLSEWVSP
jgi:hypothetical protein